MRRIYFLLPSPQLAKAVLEDLRQAGVPPGQLHAIAAKGTPLDELPVDTIQDPVVQEDLRRRTATGGTLGALAGLAAVALPGGPIIAGAAVVGSAAAGAGLGAVVASLTGRRVDDPEIKHFEDALERGEILILADVERDQLEPVQDFVQQRHPAAKILGTDPHQTFP